MKKRHQCQSLLASPCSHLFATFVGVNILLETALHIIIGLGSHFKTITSTFNIKKDN
ncbi:Uncharacterized protein TCM_012976 [Theobroma cacao]|uniref:Uncharacterized protein n=1 Tax=Theobroma cacao TaxID=3641 RepID=A0A061FW07_THECC|nr:Uncharacterized protein TCM_012976 [Theobroma cacao]